MPALALEVAEIHFPLRQRPHEHLRGIRDPPQHVRHEGRPRAEHDRRVRDPVVAVRLGQGLDQHFDKVVLLRRHHHHVRHPPRRRLEQRNVRARREIVAQELLERDLAYDVEVHVSAAKLVQHEKPRSVDALNLIRIRIKRGHKPRVLLPQKLHDLLIRPKHQLPPRVHLPTTRRARLPLQRHRLRLPRLMQHLRKPPDLPTPHLALRRHAVRRGDGDVERGDAEEDGGGEDEEGEGEEGEEEAEEAEREG
mmetsp:Transcript_26144/g.65359  ORF Transcript_26144/g.65359 Transcript_26144/m.65359 type:complete len:251 (+) Transcript_26144:935-1687(+)